MSKLNIPRDALVCIDNGRTALFLRNAGDEQYLRLTTEQKHLIA